MSVSPLDDAADFGRDRLVRVLRRWAGLVVAATVLAAVVAFVISSLLPREYESTAQLYLAPASGPTSGLQDVVMGQTLARTYVQLAQSDVVLGPAMDTLNVPRDLKWFRANLQVSQARETSIISVRFRSTDPGFAAEAANAVADTFIVQTRALQTSLQGTTAAELDTQIRTVGEEVQALADQIAALRTQAAASPRPGESPGARAELQAQMIQLDGQRQTKQQTLAQLLKTRDDMRLSRARAETTVSVWQPATPAEEPFSPRPLRNALLGGLAGALVVLVGIAILAYLDDRLSDVEEVQRRLRIAPLGQVRLHDHPETTTGKLFVRDEPGSPEAEAIRAIRTNISFAGTERRPRTLLITSALPGEGKSVLSANLALAFAEAGTPVVLVDADLRRPSQHRLFKLNPTIGLSRLLAEGGTVPALESFRIAPNLYVIPSGPLPPNPAELLGSGRMTTLLRELVGTADSALVIVDTSPLLAVADAVALSTKVEACIVVIDSSRTRVPLVRRALVALERVRAPIIGAVLNKVPESESSYYRYDGYYGVRPAPQPGATANNRRA